MLLFDRYGEVLERLEELGAQLGKLNNRDRQVMQNLMEEQEWLSATLVKRAKFLLEEIDRSFEKLFDWMITFSDLIDRAAGPHGTPGDVLRLEGMMQEAGDLREQLNRMAAGEGGVHDAPLAVVSGTGEDHAQPGNAGPPGVVERRFALPEARREAAPGAEQAAVATVNPSFPAPPFITAGDNLLTWPQTAGVVPASNPGVAGESQPVPLPAAEVVKKKKHRQGGKSKKNTSGASGTQDGREKYKPPRELVAALERKMSAACAKPKVALELTHRD